VWRVSVANIFTKFPWGANGVFLPIGGISDLTRVSRNLTISHALDFATHTSVQF
jgi:hypothetical protein